MEKTKFKPVSETVSQLTKAFRFLPNKKAVRKPMKGVKSMSQIRSILLVLGSWFFVFEL
jgi:hypothetical protein